MNESESKGQIILTGTTGGIGMATCELLAQRGYRIIAVDHKESMGSAQSTI